MRGGPVNVDAVELVLRLQSVRVADVVESILRPNRPTISRQELSLGVTEDVRIFVEMIVKVDPVHALAPVPGGGCPGNFRLATEKPIVINAAVDLDSRLMPNAYPICERERERFVSETSDQDIYPAFAYPCLRVKTCG